jgi:ubiquitin-protein ligase E3 D
MPSIAAVQKSCIMTLNNLLSVPVGWQPIVPDRRHSMPSTPSGAGPSSSADSYNSSALQTLVMNLRNQDHDFEFPSSLAASATASTASQTDSDSALIAELQDRVERIAPSLSPSDSKLVHGLVSLLSHFNSLSVLSASDYTFPNSSQLLETPSEASGLNPFDSLKRHLSDLQVARTEDTIARSSTATPVQAVQDALLWTRIDEELESVLNLCRQVKHTDPHQHHHLPPEYEEDVPPKYEYDDDDDTGSFEEYKKAPPGLEGYNATTAATTSTTDEKMRLDLEAVTLAIDRLYLVAPQLHNQRVELHASKRAQMERARASASTNNKGKGKDRDRDVRELENIINLIGRASDRKMVDQAVVLEGGMQARLEKARQRDLKKVGVLGA